MKVILGLATLALAILALEEKGRQVAADARAASGEAIDQARYATETLSRSVDKQPLSAILVAIIFGYVLSRVIPGR